MLEHLSRIRLKEGARRRTPWPAPPAVAEVMLKLGHRRRGLITRDDHEGATPLCAPSMSDRCWLRRTPCGSLFAASRPVRLQAGPCRGRARSAERRLLQAAFCTTRPASARRCSCGPCCAFCFGTASLSLNHAAKRPMRPTAPRTYAEAKASVSINTSLVACSARRPAHRRAATAAHGF